MLAPAFDIGSVVRTGLDTLAPNQPLYNLLLTPSEAPPDVFAEVFPSWAVEVVFVRANASFRFLNNDAERRPALL